MKLTYEQIIQMNNNIKQFCPYLRSPESTDGNIRGLCALLPHKEFGKFRRCTGNPYQDINHQNYTDFNCDTVKKTRDNNDINNGDTK